MQGSAAPWIAAAIALLALVVSILSLVFGYRWNVRAARDSRRPIVSFFYDEEKGWMATNLGNGPALRVVVAHRYQHEDSEWAYPTRLPDMPTGAELSLEWLGHTNVSVIGASYEDFTISRGDTTGNSYTTICANDENRISEGRTLPSWQSALVYPKWRQSQEFEIVRGRLLRMLKSTVLVDRSGKIHTWEDRHGKSDDLA